jgi:glycosyltransferase involved in cell wall biosynthesis
MDIRSDIRAARELWRVLRREKFDVLHTHNPKTGLYGRVLGRLAGVPVIVHTTHGLYAAVDDPWPKRLAVYTLEAIAAHFSDAELVQNPEDLDVLRGLPLYPAHRSRLLGNGIDLQRFRPHHLREQERQRIRAELGIADGQVVVGCVARLVVEKGYPELIAAARALGDKYVLVAVGPAEPEKPGALASDMIAQARRDGVRLLGMRSDVEELYASFDIFAYPSHREGLPRAPMEAAATGLPVVAANVRGCRQVVDDGMTGYLVPVRDPSRLASAIGRLGGDEVLRRKMGEAGRCKAEREFDEDAVIVKVLDAYHELLRYPRRRLLRQRHAGTAA